MKIKSATLLGMIGAIISIVLYVFYLLLNLEVITLNPGEMDSEVYYKVVNVVTNLCSIFSFFTFATFFYVLHKNQK